MLLIAQGKKKIYYCDTCDMKNIGGIGGNADSQWQLTAAVSFFSTPCEQFTFVVRQVDLTLGHEAHIP